MDLATLKHVKLIFDIHSDHSSKCNGYRSLLKMIEEEETKVATKATPSGAMAFHKWLIREGWTEHSSKEYFYRSKNSNSWPPDETATEEELLKRFFL